MVKEIRIAAAIILDSSRRLLLVRKRETAYFMQAGGKIETDENPEDALCRELEEELALSVVASDLEAVGTYASRAANEDGCDVKADLFILRRDFAASPNAELAEAVWLTLDEARDYPLAPLTRDHVLDIAAAYS
ncbi:NUDIX hydrolase [Denitrobaculum tricleocarpae]|uniref:NUDIX domain-containing protein n=1 Tax=Denitrobaculum tricleocarpae TaxID=2591009 RepID=A0A545TUK0_9PROT|nr:NUDIX domain-containing protein [Denitrobaculum tricleocarpae]TQV80898.1 NUDIX domain-containing protein [Denitrobaculum tricleocarpae]